MTAGRTPAVTEDSPLWQTCLHEGGHAAAGHATGRKPGPVTVVGGPAALGVAHYRGPQLARPRDWARLDWNRPVACWPAAVRRRFDVLALNAAAGDAAEALLWWPARTGRRPESAEAEAIELASEMASGLPPTAAEETMLAASRADLTMESDAEVMAALAAGMYPGDSERQAAWLHLIALEARAVVRSAEPWVLRLAGALGERGSLSAAAVSAILADMP